MTDGCEEILLRNLIHSAAGNPKRTMHPINSATVFGQVKCSRDKTSSIEF